MSGGRREHREEVTGARLEVFPTDVDGLPEAVDVELVDLADGDSFELEIRPVTKRIGKGSARMLAYNGSIPGPTLRVREGSRVTVRVLNRGDLETTVHWHGLRVRNEFDGTHETQAPIRPGESFVYELDVPDPGIYWYHPHVREAYAQELGLYGNILVTPRDGSYWPAADRELVLTLDDVLVENESIAPFRVAGPTHVAMGRFGNVMLTSGREELSLTVAAGEVTRFYLTNTANTRVFNVVLPGARLKLVGGDSGRVERETLVDEVLIGPSERVVVDALFEKLGEATLVHRTPSRTYTLARLIVEDAGRTTSAARVFEALRVNTDLVEQRRRVQPFLEAEPHKTLAFVAEMAVEESSTGAYTCPMHPEVVRERPDRCPKCGMRLVPAEPGADAGGHHGPAHSTSHEHEAHARGGRMERIEWEDDMVEVNRASTPASMRWKIVDVATGDANEAIRWRFSVDDQVKIRLVNEMDSDHPMPHPFHVHGAGRFLVLSRDGETERNLVWKDTVLVRTGETVDILLDVTNPGRWMAHCHIAEHHEGGMMFGFDVDDRA